MAIDNLYTRLMTADLNPYQILSMAKERLVGSASANSKKIKDLEVYLNAVFYNKPKLEGFTNIYNKLSEVVKLYIEDKFDKTLEKFNWNEMTLSTKEDVKNQELIPVGLHDRYTNRKNLIQRKTLEDRYHLIHEHLIKKGFTPEVYNQFLQLKDMIYTAWSTTINENSISDEIYINEKQNDNELIQLIKDIDDMWFKMTYFGDLPFPVDFSGEILEKALQVVGGDQIRNLESINEKELLNIFKESTPGLNIENRGTLKENQFGIIPNKKIKIDGKDGSSFTLNSIFAGKQGKVDVKFTLPANNFTDLFRISAKNWSSLSNHDFGETDLLSALLRGSVGSDFQGDVIIPLRYAAQVTFSNNKSQIQRAHNFAKSCAIVDILMGYSQKEGYADTIVINNRSAGQIEVYSIFMILNKVRKNLNSFHVNGYQEKKYIFFDKKKPLQNNEYDQLPNALFEMHKINIAIGSGILNLK